MIRTMRNLGLAAAFAVAALCVPASGQTDPAKAAQNKLLAKRAAEADCYRKLAEAVYGVQINSETYVRDFVTESDQIKTGVDAIVKGVKLGPPQYYEDGSCEVKGEVTVEKLITSLKEIHAAHYKGNRVTTTDITHMKETIQRDVISATGSGAPRPELPPDLPIGVEQMIEPLPPGYTPPTTLSVPDLWKSVGPQARLMAERAAEVDAQRKLLERIQGLRLTSNTTVRDFVTESDEITTQASGIVRGAYTTQKYLHTDELIVEVTMAIPVERVVQSIQEMHSQHYKGNRVTTTDITKIKESIQRDLIEATGTGCPPAKFVQQAATQTQVQVATWFTEVISVEGQGTDPAIDSTEGRLKAARAAEMDAYRKLAEQVKGLQINAQTHVKDFVTQSDEIATQVQAVISGARLDTARFDGGVATVKATLPGAEVWSVVNQYMIIQQRRGG